MTIDSKLQERLDQSGADDPIDIILILKASEIESRTPRVNASDIMAGRKYFANLANTLLTKIVSDAFLQIDQQPEYLKVFKNTASAHVRTPAKLIQQLASHPSVASILLASDE